MKILRVMEAFATTVDGAPRVYNEGMLVQSDDPAVKGRDRFFMDANEYAERTLNGGDVDAAETATAAPGERRKFLRKAAERALKRGEEMNPRGADDGEADPESGSNQVKGVNRKDADEDPEHQTAEQKRSAKAALKLGEEQNPTGADDGEADPESGASQVPGVNDDPSAKPGDGYDDGISGTADDGGPTTGITTDDVSPGPDKPAKKAAVKKAVKKSSAKRVVQKPRGE